MSPFRRSAAPVWALCLAVPLALATSVSAAAPKTALPSPTTSLPEGSFELPNLPAGGVSQSVSGSAWTFANGGGIVANAHAGWGNPAAPDGDQVAIVQNGGTITQTFTPAASGRYRLTLKATRRPGYNHTFLLRVNGIQVASINPPNTAWTTFASTPFELAQTPTTVAIVGVGTSTDNTSFVDDLKLEPVSYANDEGFESAVLTPTGYAPTGTPWGFSGASGVFTAPSAWGNVAAPEGSKFALLQGNPNTRISQTITTPAGRYQLRLYGAQRYASPLLQTVSVRIDNLEVAQFTPAGTSYESFRLDGLALGAGTHVIEFVALKETPDKTAFLDQIRLVPVASAARRWSDPATWGGSLPTDGDEVTIPSGSTVLLDMDPPTPPLLESVTVASGAELHCDDRNIRLAARSVLVSGRFICGARATPYQHDFELTLHPPKNDKEPSSSPMGIKLFAAMAPGVVELHGRSRTSWTQISATAALGTNSLKLATAVNWEVGDRIVIAPTRWTNDAGTPVDESEVRTISAVNTAGTELTLDSGLSYRHYAGQQNYSVGGTSLTLDERAEVGLLSRNITIQGDAGSSTSRIGGHMMSMAGSTVHVSGVEFHRMGQYARLARYPFHWHIVGDADGQYLENSSVHESYNRCVTIHRTNRVRVAGNVCYNFIGHGYFLEDGNEQFNVIDGNLGVSARRPLAPRPNYVPALGELPLETDLRDMPASSGPAIYWISNPNNTVTNNVGAATPGAVFWYHLEPTLVPATQPPPAPGTTLIPNVQPFGTFDNNRGHSSKQGLTLCHDGGNLQGVESPNAVFNRITVNQVGQGIWPCDTVWANRNQFRRAIVANTPNGMQAPTPSAFFDSAFVAYTSGNKPAYAATEREVVPWAGIVLYDQGFEFDNVQFVNYNQPNMSAFASIGGAGKLTENRLSRTSFVNSPQVYADVLDGWRAGIDAAFLPMPLHDLDGSLTGHANRALVPRHPLLYDHRCVRAGSGRDGYVCPYRYSQFRFDFWNYPLTGVAPKITDVRSDGASDSTAGMEGRHLSQVMADGEHRYAYRLDAGIRYNNMDFSAFGAMPGDSTVHQLVDVPGTLDVDTASVDPLTQQPREAWQAASSLKDLLDGPGHRYFHDTDAASLFIKTLAAGEAWTATDFLRTCMVAFVGTPRSCPPRTVAPPAPPTISLTSMNMVPGSVSFTANVSSPDGIAWTRVFVDDEIYPNAQINSSPLTYQLALPLGVHVVKLVAATNAGVTYTEFLRLAPAGETTPRVSISSLVANGTYVEGQVPALGFTTQNLTAGSLHTHWLLDGADQGDTGSATIVLMALPHGRHEVEVAAASAQHEITAADDRRTIYVMGGGVIADFDQGPDRRSRVYPDAAKPDYDLPGHGFGPPASSQLDNGGIDANFFITVAPASGVREGRFLLQLAPSQDWQAQSALRIRHNSVGFTVYLHRDGAASPALLGSVASSNGAWLSVDLPLNGVTLTGINAIELRQNTLTPGTPGCAPGGSGCSVITYLDDFRLLPSGNGSGMQAVDALQ